MVSDDFMARARQVLNRITFLGYRFEVSLSSGGSCYLRANYDDKDVYSGDLQTQFTRRWLLSPQSTDSEIVQTAFKACLTSMEHRTREHFKYRGARVFGPHFDVEDLVALCRERENAGGRTARETEPA